MGIEVERGERGAADGQLVLELERERLPERVVRFRVVVTKEGPNVGFHQMMKSRMGGKTKPAVHRRKNHCLERMKSGRRQSYVQKRQKPVVKRNCENFEGGIRSAPPPLKRE